MMKKIFKVLICVGIVFASQISLASNVELSKALNKIGWNASSSYRCSVHKFFSGHPSNLTEKKFDSNSHPLEEVRINSNSVKSQFVLQKDQAMYGVALSPHPFIKFNSQRGSVDFYKETDVGSSLVSISNVNLKESPNIFLLQRVMSNNNFGFRKEYICQVGR